MQQFSGISLKTRLYLMVLAAFLPVALLVFYVAEEQKALEIAALYRKNLSLVQAVANEENLQLEAARTLLTAVAETLSLAAGSMDRLTHLLTEIRRESRVYAAWGILGPGGRLLAGGEPFHPGQDFSGQAWFAACREADALVIGAYHGEHLAGRPVLYVARPVFDQDKRIVAVPFTALDLNWMNRHMLEQLAELPRGSRLTLLDEKQGILRYDADAGQWSAPQDVIPALREKILERRAGTLSAVDEDALARIYAFAPLRSTIRDRRVDVVLEIPQELALAASQKSFYRNLSLLLIAALIALGFIWWAGEKLILGRVRAMVGATRRLAAGDLEARIGPIGAHDELSHLAAVFDEMAAALQQRVEQEARVAAHLERSRDKLRRLAAYENEVREQERIRIAREIHDQLGQSLTILRMDLAWLEKHLGSAPSPTAAKLAAMSQVIAEALDNLHTVTAELRPVILDDFGLAAAIEWQVEEFRQRTGIDCRWEPSDFEPDLPKGLATALFRVFQETLTNILRHAQADVVRVELTSREGDLVLTVADNGRGIRAAEVENPQSFGLLGMRERLYPWNGHIAFEGQPGRGTRVVVRLPLPLKGTSL
jgi:signal transduction histidine kinase